MGPPLVMPAVFSGHPGKPRLSWIPASAGMTIRFCHTRSFRRVSIRMKHEPGFPMKDVGNDNDEADKFQFEQKGQRGALRFLELPCAPF